MFYVIGLGFVVGFSIFAMLDGSLVMKENQHTNPKTNITPIWGENEEDSEGKMTSFPARPFELTAAGADENNPNSGGESSNNLMAFVPNNSAGTKVSSQRAESYPYHGKIVGTWSAALRSSTDYNPNNPHAGTIADLPQGTLVKVWGKAGNWLKVEVLVAGEKKIGFVSHELIAKVANPPVNTPHQSTTPQVNSGDDEVEIRTLMTRLGMSSAPPANGNAKASTKVSPDVALKILDNLARKEPPFRPELGKGGASWFVTEGNPYVGVSADKTIGVNVEISGLKDAIKFDEARLKTIFDATKLEVAAEAEAKYRSFKGIGPKDPLNSASRKSLAKFVERFAESRMWDKVGQEVAASKSKVGEVVLKAGGKFSKTEGKFAVVADAKKISVRGGVGAMAEALKAQGMRAEPIIEATSKEWARQRNVGRVQGVFKYGGRILIVVGIANDVYRIYRAENKLKETIKVAGGWGGAALFSAAFATWFTPADVAGPPAWIVHGVGTLIAGGIGYFVGSESTGYVYELVVDEN